jgi:hypothetical protein
VVALLVAFYASQRSVRGWVFYYCDSPSFVLIVIVLIVHIVIERIVRTVIVLIVLIVFVPVAEPTKEQTQLYLAKYIEVRMLFRRTVVL